MEPEARELLEFWYSDAIRACWFASTPALDDEIRQRYEALWLRAMAGELASWEETPEGALALAIVLDQLPLNMYRGEARAHAGEARAIALAREAIARGHDRGMGERALFLYMPLMHSERLEDQELSVERFHAAGLDSRYPEHHRDIVRRFGRFPHRNEALGRASSQAELDYLASPTAFKG